MFWIDLFTEKQMLFYKRNHRQLRDRCDSVYSTSHSFLWYPQRVAQLWTTFSDIKSV